MTRYIEADVVTNYTEQLEAAKLMDDEQLEYLSELFPAVAEEKARREAAKKAPTFTVACTFNDGTGIKQTAATAERVAAIVPALCILADVAAITVTPETKD